MKNMEESTGNNSLSILEDENNLGLELDNGTGEEKKVEKQLTGISGEFFVAAELAKRNFQVALTLGNAKGIDLFATNQVTEKTFEIEVKTLRKKPNCFTLNFKRVKKEKIFIFVYLNEVQISPDYYIMTGEELLADPKFYYGSSLEANRQTVNHGPLKIHHARWDKLD